MSLRVAVVGAGVMGRLHARAIARRAQLVGDCALSLVLDRHPDRRESVAAEFGGAACDFAEVEWSSIDAAIVATPTVEHVRVTRDLLDRGLDILLEKPMTLAVETARSLAQQAERGERILQVGHTEWYNAAWRQALTEAGTPQRIEVDRRNPRADRGLDMDVVQDLMLHDLDWVTRILGEEIVSLEAKGRSVRGAALDEAEAELCFSGGCVARLRVSRVHPERDRRVCIEGSEGIARADLVRVVGPASKEAREPLDAQWADFLRACKDRKPPENDAGVGVSAVALVERVRASIGVDAEDAADADDSDLRR